MTRRQRDTLLFIRRFVGKYLRSPNYDEIAEGMGWHTRSIVHKHVRALVEAGVLAAEPNKKFHLKLPGHCEHCGQKIRLVAA